jgi:hypothetical protein
MAKQEQLQAKRYVLTVFGGVSPELHGPYKSAENRDRAAKKLHAEGSPEEDSVFWLTIWENGRPEVGCYTDHDLGIDE